MKAIYIKVVKLASTIALGLGIAAAPSLSSAAATDVCGNNLIESVGTCLIADVYQQNNLPAAFSNAAVGTVTITAGNQQVNLSGAIIGASTCFDPFQANGSGFGTISGCAGVSSTENYLVFVFDTSAKDRQWTLSAITGADLLAGYDYQESSNTGNSKYKVYEDGRDLGCTANCGNVPLPGSIALLGLGLLGFAGIKRRT